MEKSGKQGMGIMGVKRTGSEKLLSLNPLILCGKARFRQNVHIPAEKLLSYKLGPVKRHKNIICLNKFVCTVVSIQVRT
ncbi:Hypothetical protein CINCED_3A002399 [Cinara cedri]|uniref:Uncharacterized protein n=1 Tax=Cinara cedri TaxID=506608 RepID=A0A5E4M6L2_9HEMI|nr:Hypothetical protein CINCED_3A002399 [Cinara cedri]